MARDDTRWHEKTRQVTRRHGKVRARGHRARAHGMFPTQGRQRKGELPTENCSWNDGF